MRQLVFTSALCGLAGRSGFCTVARHASLRERIVSELERMSEYAPPTGTRPTVFLFRVYSGGDEPLYILSRLGDAGTDGFGRPNHVAHHLVFRGNELSRLPPPAEVALRFPAWCEKYSGAPKFFDEDEPLPTEILRAPTEKIVPARRWQELTGDAGNAALLCPHGDPRATVFVGDDSMTRTVLGLFAESAETAGAENAWEIAFSTGICSEKNRGRFLWRMVAARELAVRCPGDFILDFLAPLAVLRAPKTNFAEYARTGVLKPEFSPAELAAAGDVCVRERSDAPSSREEIPHSSENTSAPGVPAQTPAANRFRVREKILQSAGTLKFLVIATFLVVAVVVCSFLFGVWESGELAPETRPAALAQSESPVGGFVALIEERIAAEDVVGAAEAWLAFSEAFPQAAEARKGMLVPRFKLKVADAYAERFSRRLRAAKLGGTLPAEEKTLVAAELAMFRRICRELELTPGRIQRKNLLVVEQTEALLAEPPREK